MFKSSLGFFLCFVYITILTLFLCFRFLCRVWRLGPSRRPPGGASPPPPPWPTTPRSRLPWSPASLSTVSTKWDSSQNVKLKLHTRQTLHVLPGCQLSVITIRVLDPHCIRIPGVVGSGSRCTSLISIPSKILKNITFFCKGAWFLLDPTAFIELLDPDSEPHSLEMLGPDPQNMNALPQPWWGGEA